jgi:hypothetical protein
MMLSKDITNNVFNLTVSLRELQALADALEFIGSEGYIRIGYEEESRQMFGNILKALEAQK